MINEKKVDIHHHILPEEYLNDLKNIGIDKSFGLPFPNWSLSKSIELMEQKSINYSFLSIPAPGIYFNDIQFTRNLARKLNEIIADCSIKHPDKFGGFGILPLPDPDYALNELEYVMDTLKMDGVLLLANVDGIYLGDSRWQSLYDELDKRKATVLIHPNVPAGYEHSGLNYPAGIFEVTHDTTRAVANLLFTGTLEKYSGIRFILSHAGGAIPYIAFRISLPEYYEQGKNLLKSVAPAGVIHYLQSLYYDIAMASSPYTLACLKEFTNNDHIIFGTDCPFTNNSVIDQTIIGIKNSKIFTDIEKENINYNNVVTLFPKLKQII